jgi:hypothetical protein
VRVQRAGEKLVACWLERSQVGFVLPGSLVDHGVELEVDLIEAAREMDGERLSMVTTLESVDKAVGEPEVEQVGRGRVEPILGQVEVARDLVTRFDQRSGQRPWLRERPTGKERDNVDVAGGPADQPEGEQPGAADDDEFDPPAACGELLAQGREELISLYCVHDRDDSHPDTRCLTSRFGMKGIPSWERYGKSGEHRKAPR